MKRVTGAFALVVLGAAGMAMAQSASQSAPPAGTMPQSQGQYPSSTSPSSSSSTSSSGSMSSSKSDHAARKEQMKDCMAQQKANNSGMSKSDMKKYCKNQVENSSTSSSSPRQ